MTKAAAARGYSAEFSSVNAQRVTFTLDKIPPALWLRVRAKAKRDGVSLRSLMLRWCEEWVQGKPHGNG